MKLDFPTDEVQKLLSIFHDTVNMPHAINIQRAVQERLIEINNDLGDKIEKKREADLRKEGVAKAIPGQPVNLGQKTEPERSTDGSGGFQGNVDEAALPQETRRV